MIAPADFQEKLDALNTAYAAQLPEKLKQIEQIAQLLDERWDENGLETLLGMAHSLSGSGRTFGFPELSDKARDLEQYLHCLMQEKIVPNNEQLNHMQVLLGELLK